MVCHKLKKRQWKNTSSYCDHRIINCTVLGKKSLQKAPLGRYDFLIFLYLTTNKFDSIINDIMDLALGPQLEYFNEKGAGVNPIKIELILSTRKYKISIIKLQKLNVNF